MNVLRWQFLQAGWKQMRSRPYFPGWVRCGLHFTWLQVSLSLRCRCQGLCVLSLVILQGAEWPQSQVTPSLWCLWPPPLCCTLSSFPRLCTLHPHCKCGHSQSSCFCCWCGQSHSSSLLAYRSNSPGDKQAAGTWCFCCSKSANHEYEVGHLG